MINSIIADRYKICDRLGEGGTAITYKAVDLNTSQEVAIKVLSLDNVDWKQADLFEKREVKTLRELNHPRIPRYIDYFVSDNEDNFYFPMISQKSLQDFVETGILLKKFYLVQELVKGKNLVEWRDNINKVNQKKIENIAIQVLDILTYLQTLIPPVVHRDIKPQNLIYTENKEIFLVDFGAVPEQVAKTSYGTTFIGTKGYMAPEQGSGGKVSLATDLYGLGATLIYLLSGRNPSDLPRKRLKIDFRKEIKVSSNFAQWLDVLLEFDPDNRFQNAEIALNVLEGKGNIKDYIKNNLGRPKYSSISLTKTKEELTIKIPCALNRKRWNYALGTLGISFYIIAFLILLIITISTYNIFWRIPIEDDNKLYLVQELVAEKNLNQQVEEGLRLTEKEVKDIAVQVLSILDYLHNFDPRIIHRDIKPHNLILSDDGQIFLVDFGAVHNAYYNTMIGETVGIGTIGYMSPEQQIGKPVPASDLYSLGRTLLYLLTRRPPDHLLEHKATVNLEIIGDYIQLSDEFIEWLEKILDPDVDERFSSAKEALKALQNPKLVKQGKLSKNRWLVWLGLGFASVVIATFSYNYRWAILNSLGFSEPLQLCLDKETTFDYFEGGGQFPKSKANKCLLWSVEKGYTEIVELAITNNADINIKSRFQYDANTLLDLASKKGFKEIINLLIARGADVNNYHPLGYAAKEGHEEVVKLLIAHGADVNRFNALCYAAEEGYENIVTLLIAHGAKVNSFLESALHCAAYSGHKNIVELLIAHGADVNHTGNNRNVPVSYAAYSGHKDIVKLLIAHGANLNARNRDGRTPLSFAKGNKEIIELLKKHGAR